MGKRPVVRDANASLELIVERFMKMGYVLISKLPEGSGVIRLDYSHKTNREFFYFFNKSTTQYVDKFFSIAKNSNMQIYEYGPVDVKKISKLVMYNCYIVDEIDDKCYNYIELRKKAYNVSYSFAYSVRDKKMFIYKNGILFSGKLKELNKFLLSVFND